MRQTDGSVVCTGCGRLVDVNEKNCPHCGQWRPGMFGYSLAMRDLLGGLSLTYVVVFTCSFLFVLSLVIDLKAVFSGGGGFFNFLSPGNRALWLLGITSGHLPWYTTFSATLLHGSALHIFFNMMWTRDLGSVVEDEYGPARFLNLFVLSGAGGFWLSNTFSGAPTLGASGAVFGLLAAVIAFGRHHGGSFGSAISQRAWGYALLLFVMGFVLPGINNYAHFGGFVTGYAVATVQLRTIHRGESPIEQLLALILALGSVAAVVVSMVTHWSDVYRIG